MREKAKINGVNEMVLENIGLVEMFLVFFPREWLEEVVVAHLKTVDSLRGIEFGEMLRWLGVWFLLATTIKTDRKKFWSTKAIDRESGAPFRVNDIMSQKRFETILSNLHFTTDTPPTYKDRF